ncbi:MAG: ankyrin repeat domain-containing protein [Alphaproteobacteria bacterium]|nr:ankyrin repeat domain-containing protein [Alphaproteobacteria bacterium]
MTVLHNAVLKNDIHEVKKILSHSTENLDDTNEIFQTPLYLACDAGFKDIVEILLSYKPDIAKKIPVSEAEEELDIHGIEQTAFHAACHRGYEDIVDLLIAHGADMYTKREHKIDNGDGIHQEEASSILIPASRGHLSIVKKLLAKDSASLFDQEDIKLAYILAVEYGSFETAMFLSNHLKIEIKDKYKEKLLLNSAKNNILSEALFSNNAFTLKQLNKALEGALSSLSIDSINILLAHGANINETNAQLLVQAITSYPSRYSHHDVGIFEKTEKDLYRNGLAYQLHFSYIAPYKSYLDSINLLNDYLCINPDSEFKIENKEYQYTMLHAAAENGEINLVKELIGKYNINAQDYKGNTPLHYAVASENKDVIKLLIEEGADQNIENFKGITPRFFNPTLKDAVKDYTRTCVLPLLLQSTDLNTDPSTLTKQLSQQVRDVLLLNVNTLHVMRFNHHWHDPAQQASLNKVKDLGGKTWEPLFNVSNIQVNVSGKNWSVVPLNTTSLLKDEEKRLGHCVGGYTNKCFSGYSHILSIRNEKGESQSTFEILTEYGKKTYHLQQHYGPKNASPSSESGIVLKSIFDHLDKGILQIDYDYLNQKLNERLKENEANKYINEVGYDYKSPGKIEEAQNAYRASLKGKTIINNFKRLTLSTFECGSSMFKSTNEIQTYNIKLIPAPITAPVRALHKTAKHPLTDEHAACYYSLYYKVKDFFGDKFDDTKTKVIFPEQPLGQMQLHTTLTSGETKIISFTHNSVLSYSKIMPAQMANLPKPTAFQQDNKLEANPIKSKSDIRTSQNLGGEILKWEAGNTAANRILNQRNAPAIQQGGIGA